MKLYYHPVSNTSRPVLLFAADHDLELSLQVVDLFTGEHTKDAYAAVNPSRLVPVLEDGDFRLTECSAIPEAARPGERAHGLVQHAVLPRLGLRPHLKASSLGASSGRRPGSRCSTRTSSAPITTCVAVS